MPTKSNKVLSFEQSMSRLESISAALEQPETGLEETIRLVEEGLKLVKSSRELLHSAELRIKKLEAPTIAQQGDRGAAVSRNAEHDFSLI